jgi:hypothetical protein
MITLNRFSRIATSAISKSMDFDPSSGMSLMSISHALVGRRHEGAPHGVNAGLLIVVDKLASDGMPSKRAMPPAGQDALFNGRTGCVGRVADADEFNQLRETDGPP